MNISSLKKIYCIGLGGVGVSAVAKYLLTRGVVVSGSDPVKTALIDEVIAAGGVWYQVPDAGRITKDLDLVVYSDAFPPEHPERQAAEAMGIPSQNFSATLGLIMEAYKQRLCICGTNGKSTTTALAGLLIAGAGLKPSVFVGSRVSQFNGNLRVGDGSVFVAESDEYRDHFLNLSPTVAVVTNIELDHVDYFIDLDRVKQSFTTFFDRLPSDGWLVANADDPVIRQIIADRKNVITYGTSDGAHLQATKVIASAGQQTFTAVYHGKTIGQYVLYLPGIFNIMNTLAAMAGALALGVDPSSFERTIANFHGVWRRFEIVNPAASVTIINDYAHHPTAIRGTLSGAKAFYPGRRIVAVFQPHHHNRLSRLFDEFAESFEMADETMIVETYTVPGREPQGDDTKTGKDLAEVLRQKGKKVSYVVNPSAALEKLLTILQPGDVAIIMGAGEEVWRIAQPLAEHYV